MYIIYVQLSTTFIILPRRVGRGVILPKSVDTVWKVMEKAHQDMTGPLIRHTIVMEIPLNVHNV